ncbi:MAG: Coenzyme F420 hydrogenase/dehydrogenase, beta subunit C-terminal domain [Thermodesulfobacteriota bacterium]
MKTFLNLIQEVLDPGCCHRCGGCVAFCAAVNFGALAMGEDGIPFYKDKDKCIECGFCYRICPEIDALREETRQRISWSPPLGRILDVTVARARDAGLRVHAGGGGVVTALLLHLFDIGRIDGAIVTKVVAPFTCKPWLARTRQEIIEAGGFHFDASPGVSLFGEKYASYPPYLELIAPMAKQNLRRIAFVGRPCQIETLRRMETLGVVPSEAIKYYIGLFCMGNFRFGADEQERLENIGGFNWADVRKINFKEGLQIHLNNREVRVIDIHQLNFMKRYACLHCGDYAAEFADISCGGMGSAEGWTSVIIRTAVGRAIVADAAEGELELFSQSKNQEVAHRALSKIRVMSDRKKNMARQNRMELLEKPTAE